MPLSFYLGNYVAEDISAEIRTLLTTFLIEKIATASCKKFWDNSVKYKLLKFSLKPSIICLQHSLGVIFRPIKID